MKVVIVCPYSFSVPGGVQNQVRMQQKALQKKGIDARIIAPYYGTSKELGLYSVGEATHFNINGSIAPVAAGKINAARTLEYLDMIKPDVVHLHEPLVPGPCWAALYGSQAPILATFHAAGKVNSGLQYLLKRPAKSAISKVSVKVAVSEEAKRLISPVLDSIDECQIISNAIEQEKFECSLDEKPQDPLRILFVGRHEERKGLSVLLRAWNKLDISNVELRIAGTGPETEYLKNLNIPAIQWLGQISDTQLVEEYKKASIVCSPALYGESFGIVLLEAMAAKAVVVASNIDGYNQVATDENSILFEKGNVEELTEILNRLVRDVKKKSSSYKGLLKKAEASSKKYNIDSIMEKYINNYEKILQSGNINLSLIEREEAIKLASPED